MAAGGQRQQSELVALVKAAAIQERAVRRCWQLLARDALAVADGLRPAAMLDYCHLPMPRLAPLLQRMAAATGGALLCAELDGCGYLLSAAAVRAEDGPLAVPPHFVAFDRDGERLARCRWADEGEQQALEARCHAARRWLAAQSGPPTRVGAPRELLAPLLNLAQAPAGCPCQPTLNGWLLGYPVVYAVSAESADAAARCLSMTPLALYRMRAVCVALQRAQGLDAPVQGSARGEVLQGLDVVASFSAPAALCGRAAEETWAQAWLARCAAAAAGAGSSSWGRCELSCEWVGVRPVQL